MRRFYFDPTSRPLNDEPAPLGSYPAGTSVVLSESIWHHWCRVLRARVGDEAVLFDGYGGEYQCQLLSVDNKSARAALSHFDNKDHTPPFMSMIGMVMSRGDRMDYAIQKATELGVSAIQLLTSQHGEVHLKAAQIPKKLAHWQQVALSACEQCGLNRPPLILAPQPLQDWVSSLGCTASDKAIEPSQVSDLVQHLTLEPFYHALNRPADLHLILAVPQASFGTDSDAGLKTEPKQLDQASLWQQIRNTCRTEPAYIKLLIGPEGGFSQDEHQLALASGLLPWQLGDRVLRAETAPVVALATLQSLTML